MKKTVLAGILLTTTVAAPAFALPDVAGAGVGITNGSGVSVQKVDRRRVCEMRHGDRHCWWVGERDWDDRRWRRWHRDHWREGFFWDSPGVSVHIR